MKQTVLKYIQCFKGCSKKHTNTHKKPQWDWAKMCCYIHHLEFCYAHCFGRDPSWGRNNFLASNTGWWENLVDAAAKSRIGLLVIQNSFLFHSLLYLKMHDTFCSTSSLVAISWCQCPTKRSFTHSSIGGKLYSINQNFRQSFHTDALFFLQR